MAVEYEISSDVATIKDVAPNTQVARVVSLYSGQITYDDEAGSKFATATINGKSQRVMLCIAVNGTVNYDDVPSLYSTVDGHRCLNIVSPTETGTPDDVPSVNETVVIDGKNVRAVRCVLINATPVYDGVSSVCTFTGDDGKTHTAQLVNKISGGGAIEIIVRGTSPLSLPDAIADSLEYLKAFGGTKQGLPAGYDPVNFIYFLDGAYLLTDIVPTYDGKVEMDFATTTVVASAAILGGRTISYGGLFFFLGSDNKFVVDAFSATSTNRYTSTVTAQNNTRYKFTFNNKVGTLESGGTTLFTNTFTGTEANGKELIINGNNNNGSVTGNAEGIYLYSFKVWDNQGKLVANYVPCAKTNPLTVGLYDLVSDTFINAPTSGTWAAGPAAGASVNPTPDAPIDIVCNNGVLKFGQYGKNLNVGELSNQGYSSTGGISTSGTLCGTLWKIKVNPGEKYTVSYGNFPDGISGVYISTWLTDGTWNSRQAASFSGSYTYTVPENVGEVNFTLYKTGGVTIADNSWIQVEAGETATDYEPAHFGLHTDGTPEKIAILGKNLLNDTKFKSGYLNATAPEPDESDYVSSSTMTPANWTTMPVKVKAGQSYTIKFFTEETFTLIGYAVYQNGALAQRVASVAISNNEKTITPNASGNLYIWCAGAGNISITSLIGKVQIELGSPATDYEPYFNGGTATAEMLLSVDDYTDVQEIVAGNVTRKVAVKVLDGTDVWGSSAAGTSGYIRYSLTILGEAKTYAVLSNMFASKNSVVGTNESQALISGHTSYAAIYLSFPANLLSGDLTTAAGRRTAFNDWLADQYANGTPAIIVYPLETAATESVAGQALQVQAGDNTIEITQASLTGLELEAKYQAAVSLTIQEVQDANLDPNVQVTIN